MRFGFEISYPSDEVRFVLCLPPYWEQWAKFHHVWGIWKAGNSFDEYSCSLKNRVFGMAPRLNYSMRVYIIEIFIEKGTKMKWGSVYGA